MPQIKSFMTSFENMYKRLIQSGAKLSNSNLPKEFMDKINTRQNTSDHFVMPDPIIHVPEFEEWEMNAFAMTHNDKFLNSPISNTLIEEFSDDEENFYYPKEAKVNNKAPGDIRSPTIIDEKEEITMIPILEIDDESIGS
ncbi:hypothetical protein TRFO_31495 [Tritrichomonas foetus]|uniref:Uncharacterized protein n=1 Tax=Tritrichomonas foetus TaxID=1144522 RepID=A0A1J4JRC5_9EUKA|nr:hypothetical protein TRFO_31495 [Tritrichomonas foetus]|eukprot:OHT01657.1 hypothetical protein TRFO_31495 [Tritrichomonas foetus]